MKLVINRVSVLVGTGLHTCVPHQSLWRGPQLKGCPQLSNLKLKAWERTETTKDNSLKIISPPAVIHSKFGSHKYSLSNFTMKRNNTDLFGWNVIFFRHDVFLIDSLSCSVQNGKLGKHGRGSAATSRLQCLCGPFWVLPPHKGISFNNLSSRVCLWTLMINSHKIFSSISIDRLIETSLICSLLLDIFSPSPVSFFSQLWQAVQILAVCCSPLILCQTFLLRKYTRIWEEMQPYLRWPWQHHSMRDTFSN